MVFLVPMLLARITFGNFLVAGKPLTTSLCTPPRLHYWTIYFLKHFLSHLHYLNKLQIQFKNNNLAIN
jgi:hypothetical protein